MLNVIFIRVQMVVFRATREHEYIISIVSALIFKLDSETMFILKYNNTLNVLFLYW